MHQELDYSHEKEYAARLLAQSLLIIAFTGAVLPTYLGFPDFLRSQGMGIWGCMDLFQYPYAIIEGIDDLINNIKNLQNKTVRCTIHDS